MKVTFEIKQRLMNILQDVKKAGMEKEVDEATRNVADDFVAWYKRETPADKGELRQSIRRDRIKAGHYEVSQHTDYAMDLYMGTNKNKGKPDKGSSKGRVRSVWLPKFKNNRENMIAFFNESKISIMPNKASDRAVKKHKVQSYKNFRDELLKNMKK